MKRTLLLFIISVTYIMSCAKYTVADSTVTASSDYDIIVFGEEHDNASHHDAELKLLESLSKNKTAFAMEMFERDVQPVLDSFLLGIIDEEHFLANSRPWPNYETDYRDMLIFAKDNGIDVIAANIPRFMAAEISRSGDVETPDSLMFDIPAPDSSAYRAKFLETIGEMQGPMGMLNPDNMFKAQLFKDATMAMSIINYLDTHPGYKVFFICGRFHSDDGLGTVYQIRANSGYRVLNAVYNDNGEITFREY